MFVVDVAAFDGSDRFYAAQGCLGCSQGSKALTIAQQPLHRGVIALDDIVPPFSIDVKDAFEVRVVAMIDLSDHAPICMSLVGHNRHGSVQPNTLNRLVQKSFSGFRIPSRSEPEVDHLAVGIDGAPQIAPRAADADVRFIYYPAGDHNVICREGTCQFRLARRRCFSVRFVSSGANFWTQR